MIDTMVVLPKGMLLFVFLPLKGKQIKINLCVPCVSAVNIVLSRTILKWQTVPE